MKSGMPLYWKEFHSSNSSASGQLLMVINQHLKTHFTKIINCKHGNKEGMKKTVNVTKGF